MTTLTPRASALLVALVVCASAPSAQPAAVDPFSSSTGSAAADTSTAALRVEAVRLGVARQDLSAAASLARLRPQLSVFASFASRGIAFPAVSSAGYDPAYAAIARWPGDTWGLTLSWNADQLLDRTPVRRARAAVALAEARVDLARARRAEAQARDDRQAALRAERLADEQRRDAETARRALRSAAELRVEAGFLERRLDAQRELLRLAEMKYEQSAIDYEALARVRLAVLSAEHACATNGARLETLAAGLPSIAATP